MPAIIKKAVGMQLVQILQDVLTTEPNEWNYFFQPHKIKQVLSELANQIQLHNFFTEDYSINTFLDFLKTYVKAEFTIQNSKTIDNNILNELNKIFKIFKNTIIAQNFFNETAINIVSNYLNFFKLFLEGNARGLLENNQINLHADDLQQMAIKVVENNNDTMHDFVDIYISTLKISFDCLVFLKDYQAANQGVVSIAKSLFLQKNININLAITQFFGVFAYESILIDYYKNKLFLSDVQPWKENIILAATGLQQYFFDHLDTRNDTSRAALKYYFFNYFLEAANIPNPLKDRYTSYLSYYSDKNFNPLPYTYQCPTLGANKFLIQHAGLDKNKLEIVCQAKVCADGNHAQWLKRTGISQNLPVVSHYTYYVFSNESSYERDIYRFVNFEPMSTGFFIRSLRNATHAIGNAYVQYRSDASNWWQVSAHEYTHNLNFRAFGYTHRNFDEGLSYRLILDPCFDRGFQFWLSENRKNYTSLNLLSRQEFIGYNPSSLFMSYLVDTKSTDLIKILNLYQHRDLAIASKITQLIQQASDFIPWLDSYQKRCSNHTFKALGAGDNYCPDLWQKNFIQKKYTQNLSTGKTLMPSIIYPTTSKYRDSVSTLGFLVKKPSADEMETELILAIYNNDIAGFEKLLQAGANPNSRDNYNGNTPLHYLYFYANCDTRYLELLYDHGAKITANKEGFLPYAIAEKRCDPAQLEVIKSIFDRFTPAKLEDTALIPYSPKEYPLVINLTIPILATINGSLSGIWNQIAERFPRLDNIIFYALKPISMAMTNAIMNMLFYRRLSYISSEDSLVFCYYLGMNYIGMLSNQFGKKATKNIQNIYSKFFLQSLLNTFFTNPSLLGHLTYEGIQAETYSLVLWPMLSMIVGGFFFQAGEWATQKVIGKFFPVNSPISFNDSKRSYLGYSLGGTPKDMSSDLKKLEGIKGQLDNFETTLKKHVDKQAYILSFENNMTKTKDNLLELLRDSENNQELDRDNFNDFKENLINIQTNLKVLLNKGKSKPEIKFLWDQITKILPLVSEIHPLPPLQVNSRPDLVVNHGNSVTIEEEQSNLPLMSSFTNTGHTNNHFHYNNKTSYDQVPSKLRRISSLFSKIKSDLPAPPTEQELQRMGVSSESSSVRPQLIIKS